MSKGYFVCILLFLTLSVQAQSDNKGANLRLSEAVSFNKETETSSSTGQSGTGANIDVIYHKIFWRINPDTVSVATPLKYIRGRVQTNFKTISTNVSAITFDLNSVLIIDSIKFRTNNFTTSPNITRLGNVVTLNLGVTIPTIGTKDSFTVFYRGTPPAVSGAAEGYQQAKTETANQNYIYSLSESYEDRDWWPCKADMQDKIDSMDITVSVPWTGADTFWVATNGKLIDSSIVGSSRIFTFKNTYPMASYLVSIAVARYNRYYRSITLPSGYVLPGVFNIFRGKTAASFANYPAITAAMALQDSVVYKFSQKFGDYPFKRDKYGYYEGLGGAGGMEHQSFYAMASNALTSQTTLSHELMHQWFGDKVTFATWADLWLAEGFARYGEALAGELHPATGINPVSEMASAKTSARSLTTNRARITSFTTSNLVWSTSNIRAVYDRGCMVISMLRALSGDNNFYQACRNYLDSANGSGYKSATTDSLKNNFNRVIDYDLTPFFNDWVIGQGHPTTVVNWNSPSPRVLAVSVGSQTRTAGATAPYFHNVIVLRVQGALAGQDTTIVIYDIDGTRLAKAGAYNGISAWQFGPLYYGLSFTPVTVTFDPFNRTMSAGSTVQISTLDLNIIDFTVKQNGDVHDALFTLDNNSINSPVILERSADGIRFSEIGNMALQNNIQTTKQYYLKDASPLSGTNYYRAKFKYVDGSFKYSKTVKLTKNITIDNFSIVQNPVKGNLQITLNNQSMLNQPVVFEIFDASGKQVIRSNKSITNQRIELKTEGLAKGSYLIKIFGENQIIQVMKFIQQ